MRQIQGPRDLPYARHALLEALGVAGSYAQDRFGVSEFSEVARSLVGADLYWVSSEMTAVAFDGAVDLPEWSAATSAPSPVGMLAWQGQLPPMTRVDRLDPGQPHEALLRAMTWSRVRGEVRIMLLTAPDAGSVQIPLVSFASYSLPLLEPAIPEPLALKRIPELAGVTALIGATWIMMQQPSVAVQRPARVSRRDLETADKLGVSRPLVRVVDLRPMRTTPTTGSGTEDPNRRRLKVRHIVRGHWRQHYYPSDRSHRPRWIASYIKGPQEAPLHLTEPIMTWRH